MSRRICFAVAVALMFAGWGLTRFATAQAADAPGAWARTTGLGPPARNFFIAGIALMSIGGGAAAFTAWPSARRGQPLASSRGLRDAA